MLKFPRDTISCVRMLRHLARRFFRWITFPQQHLLITGWRFRETSKRRRSFNRALTVAFGLTAVVRQIFVSVCCLALSSRSQQKIRSFGSEWLLNTKPDTDEKSVYFCYAGQTGHHVFLTNQRFAGFSKEAKHVWEFAVARMDCI